MENHLAVTETGLYVTGGKMMLGSSEVFLQEDLMSREEIRFEYLYSGGFKGKSAPPLLRWPARRKGRDARPVSELLAVRTGSGLAGILESASLCEVEECIFKNCNFEAQI